VHPRSLALADSTLADDTVQAKTGGANTVTMANFMFAPTSLRVNAGTTVRWLNMDEEPHTVVSATGLFRSNALDTKDTFSFRFDKPGTYQFVCTIHPQMVGKIEVV
jgi:plastocyanin